jgi:hypothetical protein
MHVKSVFLSFQFSVSYCFVRNFLQSFSYFSADSKSASNFMHDTYIEFPNLTFCKCYILLTCLIFLVIRMQKLLNPASCLYYLRLRITLKVVRHGWIVLVFCAKDQPTLYSFAHLGVQTCRKDKNMSRVK